MSEPLQNNADDEPLRPMRLPRELPEHVAEDVAYWRSRTLEERALALEALCRAAMDILVARRQMGLPDPKPDPWPPSTVEFMRRHAPNGRKRESA